eukprot:CAMPEP_0185187760 /NCGR_PEP_ID=MMETSP1140-20130426/4959_1 /TAXON_ID=298111 /ORGANISM="Pavlova sp., Strain CCMP459" /LENGTH=59 /DNA_ID=CAMNT_0027754191 /DNA_START=19 /DNA_END=194 /DNA_ORIENTATION=-
MKERELAETALPAVRTVHKRTRANNLRSVPTSQIELTGGPWSMVLRLRTIEELRTSLLR